MSRTYFRGVLARLVFWMGSWVLGHMALHAQAFTCTTPVQKWMAIFKRAEACA